MNRARSSWKSRLAVSLLWLNFVLLWYRVNHITAAQEVTDSIHYLGALILVYGGAVAFWVYHNVRIYRKKGPRRHVRNVSSLVTHDSLQRPIFCRTDLQYEQEIQVRVIGNRKVFEDSPRSTRPSDRPAAPVGAHR